MSQPAGSEFSNDKPVSDKGEDRLGRTAFAERTAQVLTSVPFGSGLVLGIHGPWGDGKTSVLNLIRAELKTASAVKWVDFNPWRFTDEESMLVGFLQTLAASIEATLATKKEEIASWIAKCTRAASLLTDRLAKASDIVDSMARTTLEELRNRLCDELRKSTKKIVVLVDDIDRLDKKETFTMFRLIKACADFPNVCYVLAFDDVVVSAALGERYGTGDASAGRAFLEKVIQVPLKLPVAQREDLRSLCFEHVDAALRVGGVELSESQAGDFVSGFDRGVSHRLDTPRSAKRYGNALMFALPMLKGEVNPVDLLLVEALRVFHPAIYDTIRDNLSDFSGVESDRYGSRGQQPRAAQLLQPILDKLQDEDREAAKGLVADLFPRLSSAYRNMGYDHSGWIPRWTAQQRVSSPHYAPRYFTYSIPRGDISDAEIASLLDAATEQHTEEVVQLLSHHYENGRARRLIEKLRAKEARVASDAVLSLCVGTARLAHKLPNPPAFFEYTEPPAQAAVLISRLVERSSKRSDRVNAAKRVMEEANPLWFGNECLRWLRSSEQPEREDQNALTEEELGEVRAVLLDRIKERSADGQPLFDLSASQESGLLFTWYRAEGRDPVQEHLSAVFKRDPKTVSQFLKALAPKGWGERDVVPQTAGFEPSVLDNIELILDLKVLAGFVQKHCPGNHDKPEWHSDRNRSIDEMLAEQFLFAFRKRESKRASQGESGSLQESDEVIQGAPS